MSFGTLDEDGFAKLSHESFVVYLWPLVQGGLAHMCGVTWRSVPAKFETGHMRGVTWRAVPAKFKTGMCEMKILRFGDLSCIFRTLV